MEGKAGARTVGKEEGDGDNNHGTKGKPKVETKLVIVENLFEAPFDEEKIEQREVARCQPHKEDGDILDKRRMEIANGVGMCGETARGDG